MLVVVREMPWCMSYVDDLFMETSRNDNLLILKQDTIDKGQITSDAVVWNEFRRYVLMFRSRRLHVVKDTWKNSISCSGYLEIHLGKRCHNDGHSIVTNWKFSCCFGNGEFWQNVCNEVVRALEALHGEIVVQETSSPTCNGRRRTPAPCEDNYLTRTWWSLRMMKWRPQRYTCNFSHAQRHAKASLFPVE